MVVLSTVRGIAEEKKIPGPDGLVGFSGEVRGVVVEKQEKNTVSFTVGRVLRVWKNNEATNPKALEGRTVPLGPRWQKGDNGRWQAVERHIRFLRSLKVGEELTLEISHAEREHFALLELSQEQRDRAEGSGEARREEPRGEREKRDGGDAREAELRELRHEIERLKAENRELRERR
jgi:hypothetical protein